MDFSLSDEQRAFQEHLRQCPTCPARLREARQQQQLLAAAARDEFPEVRFEAPQEVAPVAEPTLVVPIKRARAVPVWSRWAIAAGVLLTVGVAGG